MTQGGAPPVIKLVYNPNNYRYNPLINPSEIVLVFTNLANELGHHLALHSQRVNLLILITGFLEC